MRETSHTPWRPCFLMDHISFSYFGRGSPSDHSCKNVLNSDHWFQTRRFLNISIKPYIKGNRPCPLAAMFFDGSLPCFLMDHISFSYFDRGSPSDHSYKKVLNSDHWFQTRRFLNISIKPYIKGNRPCPLAAMFFDGSLPCFLMDHISFSYFDRGSPSDHSCKKVLNSDHWFQTRRFLNISI